MAKKKKKKEKVRKKREEYPLEQDEKDFLDGGGIVLDLLRNGHYPPTGYPILGEALIGAPENQDIVMDFTTVMGGCSNAYYSFVFQLPKWDYNVKKVDEWMDVSPVHADAYNLMVGQRQKIESAIKTGLISAAESVTHYELLSHDARRYREILDYFKEGQTDEHVLRSLFVDRVDAYTGEGYSMITMVKRWPTIITDFIRMDSDLDDINNIRKELDVTQAEATVLKTKNELYQEWKKLFLPVLKERYARIETMVKARKKSIEEYKKWLKPYVARHKLMEESPERKPSIAATDAYMVPGFGQAAMFSGVRLWVWRPFNPVEPGRPAHEAGLTKAGPFEIDPYDNFVRKWVKRIEYRYGVEIPEKKVRALIVGWTKITTENPRPFMDPTRPYYIFFDMVIMRSVIKTPPPAGSELENIMIKPMKTIIISQNVMLLHLLELWAIDQKFDREVNELIGAPELEEKLRKEIEEEFDPPKKKRIRRFDAASSFFAGTKAGVTKLKPVSKYFVRSGPYESNFKERVTKIYMVTSGGIYQQMVDFWKDKIGVK